jgi:hypothetical protein
VTPQYRLSKRATGAVLALLCAVILTISLILPASARPFRMSKIPENGKRFGCAVCHMDPRGAGPRNAFGRDYQIIAMPAGDIYTKRLGDMDSDRDGFSNDKEFRLGSNPGDFDSRPGKKPKK